MAKSAKKKKSAGRTHHASVSHKKKHNAATRIVMMKPHHHKGKKHNKRNPHIMGSGVTPMKLAEHVGAGLVGMGGNAMLVSLLPTSLTSNNIAATLSAVGVALAEWWLVSMFDKELGFWVGFGGLMNAGRQGLNAFLPQVGSAIGLSGRGVGDFVPGKFVVPQNPILDAMTGGLGTGGGVMNKAYPLPYATAA